MFVLWGAGLRPTHRKHFSLSKALKGWNDEYFDISWIQLGTQIFGQWHFFFIILPLYNEIKMWIKSSFISFNIRGFTIKQHFPFRKENHFLFFSFFFLPSTSIFRDLKAFGQLTVKCFHGQKWPVFLLFVTNEADQMSGVDVRCWIAFGNCLTEASIKSPRRYQRKWGRGREKNFRIG